MNTNHNIADFEKAANKQEGVYIDSIMCVPGKRCVYRMYGTIKEGRKKRHVFWNSKGICHSATGEAYKNNNLVFEENEEG